MSTFSADKHQHFDDLSDMSEELAAYNVNNYKSRKGRKGGFFRPRNIILIIVAVIVVALLAYGIAFALSARQAKNDANLLMTQGKTLVNQLKGGDTTGAEQTTASLNETVDRLNDEVNTPLWSIATCIPVYGEDVKDVRVLASVANALCDQALTPIIGAVPADGLKGVIADGGINVPATVNLLNALDSIRPTIQTCADEVETVGEPNLEQLKKPVNTIKSALEMLDGVSEHASEMAQCLPGMLGADGAPVTYLLTAVNDAEPRPRGGMPGAYAEVTISDGKISLGSFVGADAAPRLTEGAEEVPAITDEERQIFGTRVALDIRDASFIPNFPRAAELEVALWTAAGHTPVAGVISLDPVFLQSLLSLTGGITTSDGATVDGTNASQLLMNEVYFRYPGNNAAQDAFFAEVAGSSSNQVINNLGNASPVDLMETISKAAKGNRLSIWMANPQYEALLVKLGAAGMTSVSETNPVAGIYFGAAIGTKSAWYLDLQTNVGAGMKNADGSTSYEVSITFANNLWADSKLDWYVLGNDALQHVNEDMVIDLFLYAPAGGSISNLQTEGEFVDASTMFANRGSFHGALGADPMTKASYNGNELWHGTTLIPSSGTTKLTYTVTTSPQAIQVLELDVTPLANEG